MLIDVVRRKGRVPLLGAADRALAGRRVSIVYTDTSSASPPEDRPRRPLPRHRAAAARAVRTPTARATVAIGKERSLKLKLRRRLLIDSVKPKGRAVVMRGHITRPLGSPIQEVVVIRRVSCGGAKVVKRFKPRRNGRSA